MTDNELRVRLYAIADALAVIREGMRGQDFDKQELHGHMHLLQLVEKDIKALAVGAYKVIPVGGASDE